jgi:hypothetical protein
MQSLPRLMARAKSIYSSSHDLVVLEWVIEDGKLLKRMLKGFLEFKVVKK